MKVISFINDYWTKEELKDFCEFEDLTLSGKKKVLFSRLRSEAFYSILDFIWASPKDELKYVCSDLGLRVGGNAGDLRERILKTIVDDWTDRDWKSEKKIIEKRKHKYRAKGKKALRAYFFEIYPDNSRDKITIPKKPKTSRSSQSQKAGKGFQRLVKDVQKWVPRIRFPYESGYQSDLVSWLEYQCGYKAKLESGREQADIMVGGKYPIELKKSPRKGDYHRLIGQIADYIDSSGKVIAVICDVKRLDQYHEFEERIIRLFKHNVKLIRK